LPTSRREGGGSGCLAGVVRRRHRDKAVEDEEKDATLDLLLKHLNATLAIYV
jgi:hypothetical protein